MFVLNVVIVLPLGALSPPLETMARGWLGTYWAELNMLDTPGLKVTVRVRNRVRVRVSLTLTLTLTLTPNPNPNPNPYPNPNPNQAQLRAEVGRLQAELGAAREEARGP